MAKRGPKPKAPKDKKIFVRIWIKQKFKKLAEIEAARLESIFSDDNYCADQLKQINGRK